MWKSLNVRLIGSSPLLTHSGALADPLNPFARAIKDVSGRRKKTDADHEELARLEWLGGLYVLGGEPCIPGENLEACIIAGAKKSKDGPQAKAGVICEQSPALQYDGPRDPDSLWADERFRLRVPVRVGQARVMRTRPRFDNWSCSAVIEFNDDFANRDDVLRWLRAAGDVIGLGDWRPKFGRFDVEVL